MPRRNYPKRGNWYTHNRRAREREAKQYRKPLWIKKLMKALKNS